MFLYLEAVEFCFVSDVGDVVHIVKVPVVRLPRGQHGHPAKLMSQSLLQIGDHTGACNSEFRNNTLNNEKTDKTVLYDSRHIYFIYLVMLYFNIYYIHHFPGC